MYAQVERKAKDGPVPVAGDMPETVRRVERMYFDRDGDVYTIRGEGSNEFQDAMYDGGARRYFLDDEFWDEVDRGELIVAMAIPENAKEQAHLQELTGAPVPIVPRPEVSRARAPRPKRAGASRTPRATQTRASAKTPAQILAEAQGLQQPRPKKARVRRPTKAEQEATEWAATLRNSPPVSREIPDFITGNLDDTTTENDHMESHEARELTLFAANNYDLWERRRPEFLKNAIRRKLKGTYDSEKALKLWEYFADEVAKSYTREFGSGQGYGIFTKAQRREAAREFRQQFEDEWAFGGFHDHNPELFPKGHTTVAKKKAKKKATRKKPRTAAQKRATKKLVAANKKRGKKKATKKKAKKKATKKRTKKKATKKKATKKRPSRAAVMKKAAAAKRKGKKKSRALAPKTVYII